MTQLKNHEIPKYLQDQNWNKNLKRLLLKTVNKNLGIIMRMRFPMKIFVKILSFLAFIYFRMSLILRHLKFLFYFFCFHIIGISCLDGFIEFMNIKIGSNDE